MVNQSTQSSSARSHTPRTEVEVERTTLTLVRPARVVVPRKAKRSSSPIPTGFYRRPGGTIWYWRRKIDRIPYNESTGFADLKDAIKWAEDKVQAIKYGHHGWSAKGIPTVQEFYDGRARTTKYDRWILPFVEAHSRRKINQITDDICREWIAHRLETDTQYGRPPAQGTIRTECSHLRAFFNRAVGVKKFLRENPWSMVDPDCKVKLPKKSVRTRKLEYDEESLFLAALRAHKGWDVHGAMLERMARILIDSGMRRNEICFLQPALVHHGALHLPEWMTKGKKARTVPVVSTVLVLLEDQRAVRKLDPRSTERYFEIDPIYLDALFKQASERAHLVPNITPHDLRRTYGSRMAENMMPKELQVLMGHSDIKTTMEHYVDVGAKKLAERVKAAGSLIAGQ